MQLSSHLAKAAESRGVAIIRRPTGGKAVLHGGDVTYCVVAPRVAGVLSTYRWVAKALIEAFALLGLNAGVAERSSADSGGADCFAQPTGADISVGFTKICGSAQVQKGGWFLQHGSIPVLAAGDGLHGALGFQEPVSITQMVAGTNFSTATKALVEGFSFLSGKSLVRRDLSDSEREHARRLQVDQATALLNPPVMV